MKTVKINGKWRDDGTFEMRSIARDGGGSDLSVEEVQLAMNVLRLHMSAGIADGTLIWNEGTWNDNYWG